MNFLHYLFAFYCFLSLIHAKSENDENLTNLMNAIKKALQSGGVSEDFPRQQYQYDYANNGITLGIYEALLSITRNDDLECVPRLVCEAAAGGRPGFSGKQIQFDTLSLTKLMSYLSLGLSKSSPILVFAKAALLGLSNRGDPYSCIINYAKCPKDQSRLLYYLNNHRGGFFRYFDKENRKHESNYHQYQYRPGYNYNTYGNKYKKNKIIFGEKTGGVSGSFKKKRPGGIYAKDYAYSSFTFPKKNSDRMVFPKTNPRILTTPSQIPSRIESDFFFGSTRFPKKFNSVNFFPGEENPLKQLKAEVTDRLPPTFHFPEPGLESPPKYGKNDFFPAS